MHKTAQGAADPVGPPDVARWWRHRRRHSYLSLAGLFLLPALAVILDPQRLEALRPLLETLAWIFGVIVLTYIGSATVEDVAKIRSPK